MIDDDRQCRDCDDTGMITLEAPNPGGKPVQERCDCTQPTPDVPRLGPDGQMDMARWIDQTKKLRFLDYDDVRFLGSSDWPKFRDNPISFIICADTITAERIWLAAEGS